MYISIPSVANNVHSDVTVSGAELLAAACGGAQQQSERAGGAAGQRGEGTGQKAGRVRQAHQGPAGEQRAEGRPGEDTPYTSTGSRG